MHGIIIADHKGNACSKYIGWRDQRAKYLKNGKLSIFDSLHRESDNFLGFPV